MAMNMDAVLRIVAKVEGNSALQKLSSDIGGAGDKAKASAGMFTSMGGALRGMAAAAATIGLAALGRDLFIAGDESQRATTRISALAKSYGEVSAVTEVAARAAKQFALGNVEAKNGVADLYGRLRPMGISLKDIESVFFGVNKSARLMGLSSSDAGEVMLQLSQAMGSGKLQGDELRSVMERLPAVGQAIAKVMGVPVSQIKQLGSEGKITTEIIIEAMKELNKINPPPPTKLQEFQKAMKDLRTTMGEELMPLLTPFVDALTGLLKAFIALPGPIKTFVLALGMIAVAAGPIAGVIKGVIALKAVLASFKIGATIAGWLPAIIKFGATFVATIKGAVGGLFGKILLPIITTGLKILVGFLSGPAGWILLAAGLAVLIYKFREPIMAFFTWLGGAISTGFSSLMAMLQPIFVQPFIDLWNNVLRGPITAMFDWLGGYIQTSMQNALALAYVVFVAPWVLLWDAVKVPVTAFFSWIGGAVQAGMSALMGLAYLVFVQPFIDLWNNVLRQPVISFITWIQGAWQGISQFFTAYVITPITTAWSALAQFLPVAMQTVSALLQQAWNGISQFFVTYVVTPITNAWNALVQFLPQAMQAVSALLQAAWAGISRFFNTYVVQPITQAWDALVQFLPNSIQSLPEIQRQVWIAIGRFFKQDAVDFITNAWNALAQFIPRAMQGVAQALQGAWSGISQFFTTYVVQPITQAWNGLAQLLPQAMQGVSQALQSAWAGISQFFVQYVVNPISQAWNAMAQLLPSTMQRAADFVKSVWIAVIESIKGVVRGLLNFIVSGINRVVDAINYLIRGYNSIPTAPDLPQLGYLSVPAFAQGGVVTGPTLAMVGEGGEPEYIIPESKMQATAQNYLAGQRGAAAIQSTSSSGASAAGGDIQIDITTGPVVEMNGERYATIADLQSVARQTATQIYATLRTPSGRRAIGVA